MLTRPHWGAFTRCQKPTAGKLLLGHYPSPSGWSPHINARLPRATVHGPAIGTTALPAYARYRAVLRRALDWRSTLFDNVVLARRTVPDRHASCL